MKPKKAAPSTTPTEFPDFLIEGTRVLQQTQKVDQISHKAVAK